MGIVKILKETISRSGLYLTMQNMERRKTKIK